MRKLVVLVGLLLSVAVSAADLRSVISREAGKCAAAWQREDFQTAVSYIPQRVIQQSGGRAALVAELKEHFAEARQLGAESLRVVPGRPPRPTPIGRWLVSLVPLTAVLHGTYMELTQDTHALALSSDQGRHWSFLPLYQTSQTELNAWFPEFRGKIVVPPVPKPRVTIAY